MNDPVVFWESEDLHITQSEPKLALKRDDDARVFFSIAFGQFFVEMSGNDCKKLHDALSILLQEEP